ncbi:MAG: hypothetical protein ABSB24_02830 [Gaiellaceae bacterium]
MLQKLNSELVQACKDYAKGASAALTGLNEIDHGKTASTFKLGEANLLWGLLWIDRGGKLDGAAILLGRTLLPKP